MRGVKNLRPPDWHLIYSAEWKEVDPWVKVIAQMQVTDRLGDIVKRSPPGLDFVVHLTLFQNKAELE